ncbi:MAG: trypsin-like peptidase domain-containing protein [Patescibacteria group bacterium]
MFAQNNSQEKIFSKNLIVLVLIFSLIFGGLAGAGTTFLILNNSGKAGILNIQSQEQNNSNLTNNAGTSGIDLEAATISAVKKTQPSVVSIIISKEVSAVQTPNFNDFFQLGFPFQFNFGEPAQPAPSQDQKPQKQEIGGGSGFIVSNDGLIITNKHVVADDAASYTVLTNDGKKYEAKVLAKDPTNDLAVIKIEAKDLTPLTLGDSDNIEVGQTVIAIGNALGEYRNTVTRGVISGINRTVQAGGQGFTETLEEAIQTDAAINPGNSGGPLLNLKGEVIGMNTAISQSGQLVGFAIPINEAKQDIESVQKTGKIVRPYLGVRYVLINKEIVEANKLSVDYGALISRGQTADELAVVPGSPADKAGLVENDIILEINGQKIDESHSLARLLAKYAPGDEVELKISHKGEEKTVKVKLEERKD